MKHLTARQWEVLQKLTEEWQTLDTGDSVVAGLLTHPPRVGTSVLAIVESQRIEVGERLRNQYRLTENGMARLRWERERRKR